MNQKTIVRGMFVRGSADFRPLQRANGFGDRTLKRAKARAPFLFYLLSSIFLLLAGCSTSQPSPERQVQTRVTLLLIDYPESRGYVRRVTETLESLAALPEKVSPEFVRNAVSAIPAENFGSGQFQSRAALQARTVVAQILQRYKTADPQKLAAIAAGMRAGSQVR